MLDLKQVVEGEVPSSDVASGANIRAVVHSSHPPSQCFPGNWDPSGFWRHCLDGVNSGRSEGVRAVQRWTTEDVLSALPTCPLRTVSAGQLTWEPTMPLHPKSWSQPVADWCGETKCPLGGTDWCVQRSRAEPSREISLKLLPASYSASPAPHPLEPPSLLRVLPLKNQLSKNSYSHVLLLHNQSQCVHWFCTHCVHLLLLLNQTLFQCHRSGYTAQIQLSFCTFWIMFINYMTHIYQRPIYFMISHVSVK